AVTVNSSNQAFTYTYGPRVIDGENNGLNKGFIGFGSNQSRGTLDNIKLQVVPPQTTLDETEDFNDGNANLYTGTPTTGTWAPTPADQRFSGTSTATGTAVKGLDLGAGQQAETYVTYTAQVKTGAMAGLMLDGYLVNDFKFVAIDVV